MNAPKKENFPSYSVNKGDLLATIKQASLIFSKKSPQLVFNCVHLQIKGNKLQLRCSSELLCLEDFLEIDSTSEASLSFFVHGDLLMKILKKLEGNRVIFQKTNTHLLISSQSKSDLFQVSSIDVDNFEKFPAIEGGKTLGKISGETLSKLIEQNNLRVDGGNGAKCLVEVKDNKIIMLTHDHARLTWAQGDCQIINYKFALDVASKQQLRKIMTGNEIILYLSSCENYIAWRQGNTTLFTLRRPHTLFNYSKFIPKGQRATIVQRKILKSALEKVQVAVCAINNAAKISFDDISKRISIRGFNPALGTQGSTELEASQITAKQQISLNIKYLLEAINCITTEEIKIYIPGGKFTFLEGNSNFHVLMPIITN
jgi:DNA polymerase III sliding clamp (beta) subunit (PCNA family)